MNKIRFLGGTASSATLKCGDWNNNSPPDAATAYVSDNEPSAPPYPQRWDFAPSKPPDPSDKSAPGLFARAVNNPGEQDAALAELRALPDVDINRYWLGAALHELKKNAEAEKILRTQQGRSNLAPIYQQWIDLRLAELATARGAKAQARALLEKCRSVNDRPDFKLRWDRAWTRARAEAK